MLESLNRLFVTLPIFSLFFFFFHISTIVFFWTFQFFRLPICFLLRVSCHSYRRVMCWVTHLASPGREVPCPASFTIPNIFFLNGADWIESFRWPSLVPPEKTKLMQDQNNEGRSFFHLWAERGFHMVLLTALSALNCTTAFINYQLISSKYDYLCSHADD